MLESTPKVRLNGQIDNGFHQDNEQEDMSVGRGREVLKAQNQSRQLGTSGALEALPRLTLIQLFLVDASVVFLSKPRFPISVLIVNALDEETVPSRLGLRLPAIYPGPGPGDVDTV